jgi:hypothetical protein
MQIAKMFLVDEYDYEHMCLNLDGESPLLPGSSPCIDRARLGTIRPYLDPRGEVTTTTWRISTCLMRSGGASTSRITCCGWITPSMCSQKSNARPAPPPPSNPGPESIRWEDDEALRESMQDAVTSPEVDSSESASEDFYGDESPPIPLPRKYPPSPAKGDVDATGAYAASEMQGRYSAADRYT